MDTKIVEKLKGKYVGKKVEMFSNNWTATIVGLDELGWTIVVDKPYHDGHMKSGEMRFYSHNDDFRFTFID